MVRKCTMIAVTFALAFCFFPMAAAAQMPRGGTIGVGYSFLHLVDRNGFNMPSDWLFSGAQPIGGSRISLVGEVAGNYKSESEETLRLHTFQGGLRVVSDSNPRVTPFAQMLGGLMNVGCCGESYNYLMIEPGGGVDVRLNRRASLRVAASFPTVVYEGETGRTFRFLTGVVLPLGTR